MPVSHASALFDVVGEGAPVGLAFVDTELRFVRINAALAAINGRAVDDHLGRRIDEVLPEIADVIVPIYRQVLETGEPILEREVSRETPASHVRHVLASWFPVRVEGRIAGVGAVVVDITGRKEAETRLEGVLQQLPVGVLIADAEGRVLLGNRQLERMGLSPSAQGTAVGATGFVGWRADGRPYEVDQFPLMRSLRTGAVVRGEEITYESEDGTRRTIEANSGPIRDGGDIVAAVVVVQDITERRLASARQDLLVRAGEVLDSALGVDDRLERFARLLVPELADYVKIELLEGTGGRRPVAIAHQDPEREALMRRWRERGTLGETERVGMATTFATGEAKLTEEIAPDAVVQSARERTGEEGALLMEAIGPRSQIVVPLRARGRVLGALSLTMAESKRRYNEADLDLARDLGLRAGLAVDNARLYEEAQASAEAEQRRAAQLDALAAASLAIYRTRRLQRRLELIAANARDLLGVRHAAVTVRVGKSETRTTAVGGDDDGEPVLSVALVARDGNDFGTITVAGRDSEFTTADQLALEDLARIASLAMENARLEERERHIARTLQASLLPQTLPAIDGLDVAARYLAGGEGTVVGGDLYDLFPVDDEWAIVVGDVCGKGAEAAALTAMVRYTIRAEAAHHASPCEVLRLLNDAILRQFHDGRFCTVLHGRVRVGDGGVRLRVAAAGHPPPLLIRAGGTVEPVTVGGPLLGVIRSVTHEDAAVDLEPGDALVCFTDGVTEGRGPEGMFGDRRLGEVLAASAGMSAEAIAERVTQAALEFQGGVTQDDLALLVVRVQA
ncbi:MAG TPA: SpoIIE family protein phosphatase [Solirubrobacteraceae bacterium]|nr:SpoIIE family protein phosphatase [Solirubrobacteraceae bacterium]